jgi:hypothetical protein
MNVKTGVRVRPFSQREKDAKSRLCVEMKDNLVRLFEVDDPDHKYRDFPVDFPLWSHDQFAVDEKGYLV